MYMDAEERKAELMAQNKMSDGRMFKLDFDPRVIGNKILPDGTRKTGIGEFIRKTSLDGYDIIGQTRKSLENRGFREVSPMNFLDNHTHFGWYSCDMRIATV